MYVKINDRGSIESFAEFEYPGSQHVDYNVVRGYDGRLYREGTEPVKPEEEVLAEAEAAVRAERDRLLSETDYLMMPDYPLNEGRRQAVLAYRQLLRDITKQSGFPRDITWPEKPVI